MQISVAVTLTTDDHWTMTTTEAADAVLKALGGDEAVDVCSLQVVAPTGVAGTPPAA